MRHLVRPPQAGRAISVKWSGQNKTTKRHHNSLIDVFCGEFLERRFCPARTWSINLSDKLQYWPLKSSQSLYYRPPPAPLSPLRFPPARSIPNTHKQLPKEWPICLYTLTSFHRKQGRHEAHIFRHYDDGVSQLQDVFYFSVQYWVRPKSYPEFRISVVVHGNVAVRTLLVSVWYRTRTEYYETCRYCIPNRTTRGVRTFSFFAVEPK